MLARDNKSSQKEIGTTPLSNSALSLGKVQLIFEKEGYEPVQKEAEILEEKTADLGLIQLQRSTGTLQIVTSPEGGSFEVQGKDIESRKGTGASNAEEFTNRHL